MGLASGSLSVVTSVSKSRQDLFEQKLREVKREIEMATEDTTSQACTQEAHDTQHIIR